MPRADSVARHRDCRLQFGPIAILHRPVYKFGWYKVFEIFASKLWEYRSPRPAYALLFTFRALAYRYNAELLDFV